MGRVTDVIAAHFGPLKLSIQSASVMHELSYVDNVVVVISSETEVITPAEVVADPVEEYAGVVDVPGTVSC